MSSCNLFNSFNYLLCPLQSMQAILQGNRKSFSRRWHPAGGIGARSQWRSDDRVRSISLARSLLLGPLWMLFRDSLRPSLSLPSHLRAHWNIPGGPSEWRVWVLPRGSPVPQAELSKEECHPLRVVNALPQEVGAEVKSPCREAVTPAFFSSHTHVQSICEYCQFCLQWPGTWPFLNIPWSRSPSTFAETMAGRHLLRKSFQSFLCSNPPLTLYFTQSKANTCKGLWSWPGLTPLPTLPSSPVSPVSPPLGTHCSACCSTDVLASFPLDLLTGQASASFKTFPWIFPDHCV